MHITIKISLYIETAYKYETGGEGQLGNELNNLFTLKVYKVFAYSKRQLDITNRYEIKKAFKKIQPDLLINSAAFTHVDLFKTEIEKAYLINSIGPCYLASELKSTETKFFHISTDYVFGGTQTKPYSEHDQTSP